VPSASFLVGLGGAIVVAVFWALDSYYLRLEKLFRELYDEVRKADTMDTADLYSMDITRFESAVEGGCRIAISPSVIWPYLVGIFLLAAVVVPRPAAMRDPALLAPAESGGASPK
jgi:hypothetical protein